MDERTMWEDLGKINPSIESEVIEAGNISDVEIRCPRPNVSDNYNKLTESYRKSFKQAGLKTVEDLKTDDECWGVWVGNVAQYTPEELYKDKNKYKDFDNLGDYYERFAVRPLKNIVFGTQDRDKEFYVHEEE